MTNNSLWYLKQGETISGPFPTRVIADFLLHGRVDSNALVSRDRDVWQQIRELADELYPTALKKRSGDDQKPDNRQLNTDGQAQQQRSERCLAMAEERKRARDRRMNDNPGIQTHDGQHVKLTSGTWANDVSPGKNRILIYLVSVILILITGGLVVNPGQQQHGADCYREAAPGLDWRYCKLQGIDLTNKNLTATILRDARLDQAIMLGTTLQRVDMDYAVVFKGTLGFADFTGASLKGVDFREADLSYANFTGADLSYADLSGANIGGAIFSDARLDSTIWIDGSTCLRGSTGKCLGNE